MSDIFTPDFEDALGRYWDAAWQEGREGRTHDDEESTAQRALSAVKAAIRAAVEREREACAKVCDPTNADDMSDWTEYAATRAECAAAIRARSKEQT